MKNPFTTDDCSGALARIMKLSGGIPEGQTGGLKWHAFLIAKAKVRLASVESERDTYKPYYDALRARHNGYDEAARKETGIAEPESPAAALDELLCEADELAQDAPVHKTMLRLAERNKKLVWVLGQIIDDLPSNRDWLDLALEAEAEALLDEETE